MDKSNPPTTFGVFKPVGHTVVVYRDAAAAEAGVADLSARGFGAAAITRYSAQDMRTQVASDRVTASPLAGFGYELDLMNIHDGLAEHGASFVVVHAPGTEQAEQVADSARATHAIAANHYNTLMIEEVTGLKP